MTTPPKTCDEWAELISAYFDRQIDQDQVRAVEAHVAQCPQCRSRLDDYERIHQSIASEKVPPPGDLVATVIAKLEREQLLTGFEDLAVSARPTRARLAKALAVAAMITLIVSATLVITFLGWPPSTDRAAREHVADIELAKRLTEINDQPKTLQPRPVAELPSKRGGRAPVAFPAASRMKMAETKKRSYDVVVREELSADVSNLAAQPVQKEEPGEDFDRKDRMAENLGVTEGGGGRPFRFAERATEMIVRNVARLRREFAGITTDLSEEPIDGHSETAIARKPTSSLTGEWAFFRHKDGGIVRPQTVIQIQAHDPPSWMIVHGELIRTFYNNGLTKAEMPVMRAGQEVSKQQATNFFVLLSGEKAAGETKYQSRFLLNVQPERLEPLSAALRQIPGNLADITGPITLNFATRRLAGRAKTASSRESNLRWSDSGDTLDLRDKDNRLAKSLVRQERERLAYQRTQPATAPSAATRPTAAQPVTIIVELSVRPGQAAKQRKNQATSQPR